MLNGIAPIIIFNFERLLSMPSISTEKVPLLSKITSKIPLPPIPIYLDEKLTGIYIESEAKSIEIETEANTLSNGDKPAVVQKGLNSTVTINMLANQNSIGLSILIAILDLIFPLVTSEEYSITYIHGAMCVFGGLLESFTAEQSSDNTLYKLSLKISTAKSKKSITKQAPMILSMSTGTIPT